jgi:hypothetical protein
MGALTEPEIFGCMADALHVAEETCRGLAWHPRRGPQYRRFLAAIEDAIGCCDQAYYWRDYDARWLQNSQMLRAVKDMTGRWLRDSATKEARKLAHPQFKALADALAKLLLLTDKYKNGATGVLGPIMPKPLPLPYVRQGRPVQVMSPGGIILP